MPRLRDRRVLDAGLLKQPLLWQEDGFALAEGYDEATHRYRGLAVPPEQLDMAITDSTLTVKPNVALEQRAKETGEHPPAGGGRPPAGAIILTVARHDDLGLVPSAEKAVLRDQEPQRRPLRGRLQEDQRRDPDPPCNTPGANLKVAIEIEATNDAGFDEGKVRTVSENDKTLRFDQSGFEES